MILLNFKDEVLKGQQKISYFENFRCILFDIQGILL
jgi:hypothetical protein